MRGVGWLVVWVPLPSPLLIFGHPHSHLFTPRGSASRHPYFNVSFPFKGRTQNENKGSPPTPIQFHNVPSHKILDHSILAPKPKAERNSHFPSARPYNIGSHHAEFSIFIFRCQSSPESNIFLCISSRSLTEKAAASLLLPFLDGSHIFPLT